MLGMNRWVAARTPLVASFEHAMDVLVDDARHILPGARPDGGGALLEVTVPGPGGGDAVGQEVEVSLGASCAADGEAWVPIRWVPVTHTRLLPSFDGVVEVVAVDGGAELAISGTYGIPLGAVGRFGDGLLGRRVAQQSLRVLAARMAGEIDRHVARRLDHARDLRHSVR